MLTKQNLMNRILERFPDFQAKWQAHLDYWEGDEAGLCNDVAAFSQYVVGLIKEGNLDGLGAIFQMVEQVMDEGDPTARDAIATCFLENLINQASAGNIPYSAFVGLLGPRSRAFCKAWDEFTGVPTEGL